MEENQKKCYEIAERIYDLDVKVYESVGFLFCLLYLAKYLLALSITGIWLSRGMMISSFV